MDDPYAEMDFAHLGTEADSCCEIDHAVNDCSIAVDRPHSCRNVEDLQTHGKSKVCAQIEEGHAEDAPVGFRLSSAQTPCSSDARGAGEICKFAACGKGQGKPQQRKAAGTVRGTGCNMLDIVGGLSTGVGVLEPKSGTGKTGREVNRAGIETAEQVGVAQPNQDPRKRHSYRV